MHGEGRLVWMNPEKTQKSETMEFVKSYRGHFFDDVFQGKGLAKYTNGNVYEGSWQDGKRCGYGTLTNDKGQLIYVGNWKYNRYHG